MRGWVSIGENKLQAAEGGKNSNFKYTKGSDSGMVCFGEYASYQFNCKFCDFLQQCREFTTIKSKAHGKGSESAINEKEKRYKKQYPSVNNSGVG